MKQKYVGLDLGSSNLIIYTSNKGIIFNEPNVIALNNLTNKVECIGYLALKMLGKETDKISVHKPMENGVLSSITMQTLLIKQVLKEKRCKNLLNGANLIVSTPSKLTEVNKLSIKKLAKNLEVKSLELVPQSILALYSSSNWQTNSRGNFIVTIGGGCTDMSITSGITPIISKTCPFSGKMLDEAISRHLRKKHRLIIGEKTSEYIKMKIGSLEQFPENRLLEVSGKDIVTSLPSSVVISTIEIKQAITPYLNILIENITDCLEITPSEIASDIIESGIAISGGSSILGGIREYLENNLNITVRVLSDPSYSVINGIKNFIYQKSKK